MSLFRWHLPLHLPAGPPPVTLAADPLVGVSVIVEMAILRDLTASPNIGVLVDADLTVGGAPPVTSDGGILLRRRRRMR